MAQTHGNPEFASSEFANTVREGQHARQQESNGNEAITPQTAYIATRPPLQRIDSRSSFPQLQQNFNNQMRPPPPQQIRHPQPGTQGYMQRPPGSIRPPFQQQNPPFVPNQQQQPRPINPNMRPATPYPRQPGPPPRPMFHQQRSAGQFNARPIFENTEQPARDFNEGKLPNKIEDEIKIESQRQSRRTSDASPMGSLSGSIENLEKKIEHELKMNTIQENVVKEEKVKQVPYQQSSVKTSQERLAASNEKINEFKDKERENPKTVIHQLSSEERMGKRPDPSGLNINLTKSKSLGRIEGDNDSGVDESTQGNDQSSNGEQLSPRKSSGKTPRRISSTTPTKSRSLSRGSKSPSLKSPDSTATTPGSVEKKKLPMNKIQVGSAPSPNLKVVKSKIGSLENASYKPGGGHIKIESKKIDFKNAAPRIEAKNEKYAPKGGEKKIIQQKLQWNAKSKIGSLENTSHKPKGGDKKIETVKLDFKEKAKPKVGSKDNMTYVPGGGDVKIENKKLDLKVHSKIGSLDNIKHKPGGGEKKIFDDKDYLKQMSGVSSENHSLSGSQNSLPQQSEVRGADENLNQKH